MIGFLRFSLKNFGSFLSIAEQCLKQIIGIIIISVKKMKTLSPFLIVSQCYTEYDTVFHGGIIFIFVDKIYPSMARIKIR
jgi:hypothetical protein